MEYRKVIEVLIKMQKAYNFTEEEKEAILMAIGTLDCGALADNRLKMIMKSRKEKRNS